MNRNQFAKTERREVGKRDLLDALKGVLLAPRGKTRSENREPTKTELEARHRLDRRAERSAGDTLP